MFDRWMQALIAAALLCPLSAVAQPAAPETPAAPAGPTSAPADAKVYFISPANGATLKAPFVVQFGLRGMGVTQAGSTAANAGHHHLFIDVDGPIAPNEVIPSDKNHLHFGAGQTETSLDLPPGRHTLQLVLGDAKHRPFAPILASEKITVQVVTKLPRHRHHWRW
jgi:Domain of unknown function (DUF4399)